MCILRLPASVVEIEAARLEGIVMASLASETVTTRQAANTILLAIQCVLGDDTRTLALFPGLSGAQRNLATYLMETNGLLRSNVQTGHGAIVVGDEEVEEERRQKVLAEMEGQMAKGAMSG
jgi:CLIP-associating protein 1/2